MKKALSLLLALVMVLSLVACGKAPAAKPAQPAADAPETKPAAEAPAESEIVNLVVLHRGNVGNTMEKEVIAELNRYSAEKIGVTITWIPVDAAEFGERLSRMIAAKDELDLTFVASYTGYADLVAKGGLMDITDMLHSDEYAELLDLMPKAVWDSSTIKGRYYCVPNYKETPFVTTLVTPVALADTIKEKYGVDFNAIEIGSYRELDKLNPYLDACIAEGVKYPMLTNELDNFIGQYMRSDTKYELIGTDARMPYVMNKETHEVSNMFENPDFIDWFEIMTSWNEKGYWHEDNIPIEWNPRDQWALDTWGIYPQNGIPDNATQQSVSMGQPVYSINMGPATITANGTLGSTWAIPAHTQKAEAAMKWIKLIQTDRYFADTYIYGIEGVNYNRISEDVVEVIPNSGWSNGRWKTCNYENASITSADSPDLKAKYEEFNNAGVLAELASFTPDFAAVESEKAAVQAVLNEVYHLYTLGFMTKDDLADTVASFKAAGDDVIIAELQKQVDEFFGN